MKTLNIIGVLLMAIIISIGFTACSGDDDEPQQANVVGHWSGTHTYTNPVSGRKYSYLSIDFYADGTGMLEREGPSSTSVAYFT